jgi:heat shock protein HslJ
MKKNIFFSLLAILIVLGGAVFLLNNYLYPAKLEVEEPQRVALSGVYLCMPVREGMQDQGDCASGIQTGEGTYYAIDFGLMSQGVPQIVEGDRIQASGIVTPIENLSTDYWRRYPAVGIFSVTDSLSVTKEESAAPLSSSTPLQSDAEASSLFDTSWVWLYSDMHNGTRIDAKEGEFVLSFKDGASFGSTSDCNSMSGIYSIDGEVLSLGGIAMTLMYCEGSQEGEYVSQLELVNSYHIEGDTLMLQLDRDFGVMVFRAQ